MGPVSTDTETVWRLLRLWSKGLSVTEECSGRQCEPEDIAVQGGALFSRYGCGVTNVGGKQFEWGDAVRHASQTWAASNGL